jgi:bifunctional non-homologous end joining protein LigD
VRTGPDRGGKEQWLLIHKHDEYAVDGWRADDHPESVLTGRTNEEVAAERDAVWHTDRGGAGSERGPVMTRGIPVFAPADEGDLRAIDELPDKGGTWRIAGREVAVTNLAKVLFPGRSSPTPAHPVTKRDLLRYLAWLAPVILPYLEGRPLHLHRYPNGAEASGFWQKARPEHAPEWVGRWHNDAAQAGEAEWYVVADEVAVLAWIGQQAALELHPWTSRVSDGHKPAWALVDIDPGTNTAFDDVRMLARLFRTAFDHLGVEGLPKVTGKRGLQIWIPIEIGPSFDETRDWVETISRAVGATVPELVSWQWTKDARGGKARLDYTQNAINRTLVAPYSPRAAAGAPVSMPITWDELDDPHLRPDGFTIRDVRRRLDEVGDLFRPLLSVSQRLPALR